MSKGENVYLFNSRILHNLSVLLVFMSSLLILPYFFIFYCCVQFSRKLWLKILSYRFPHLTFVKNISIRTLLDNYRNQGVINVLMTLQGLCQPELIQQMLIDHILNKQDASGSFLYPKLRAGLVSCWGNYAWKRKINFNMENHFIVGKPTYRGRPISEHNIQEYVNEIVSRYLPSNLPPWQIVVIPNIVSSESKYFVLIRLHHLLIANDEPLKISDFLFLNSNANNVNNEELYDNQDIYKNQLSNIIEMPKALPKLYNIISDSLSNIWNEFISEFDPIESTNMLTSSPGILQYFAVVLISFVSACKELTKSLKTNKYNLISFIKCFLCAFLKEVSRRGFTPFTIIKSIRISLNPINILCSLWWLCKLCTIRFFYSLYFEIYTLLTFKYYDYPDTVVSFIHRYVPLLFSAGMEVYNIIKSVFTAPLYLICEFFSFDDNEEPHHLQTVSLCGRKVVSWSQPIPKNTLKEVATILNVSETEVLLSLTTSCLKEYFKHAGFPIPKTVPITARLCDSLLTSTNKTKNHKKKYMEGIICLPLPVAKSNSGNINEETLQIKNLVQRVKDRQSLLFILGDKQELIVKMLPTVLARIVLNYLSRKYSVTLTEVTQSDSNLKNTLWGHTVLSLLCWKPPQGNISMSLVIQRYADTVRIGIMADAQLSPHHMAISRHWNKLAKKMVINLGISSH